MTDASYALADYIQTLDNLPSELQHIYEELATKERLFLKCRREKDAREAHIFRHIRQHGGHSANPFEDKYNKQIEELFDKLEQIQQDKCLLADKAKELMDRHLNRLNLEIKRLEEDGQIVPLPTNNTPSQPETNGTATPNGAPANAVQTATQSMTAQPTPTVRVPSATGGPAAGPTAPTALLVSQSPTPAPRDKKRKAATAFRRDSSATAIDEVAADEDSAVYCFCQQVSFGEMVACDNEACEREWFHYPCVGLTSPPQGAWYCEDCLAIMATQKQRGPTTDKKKVTK